MVAAFPQVPRVIKVEMFVAGKWTDITADVYARDSITITRGRSDEQSRAAPSSCRFTLGNRSGKYSPRNPVSIYYGTLGRNTPLRVSVELASDTFTRTVANGWGTSDTGRTYTLSGAGGTVLASDLSVAAGVGAISIPVANAYRNVSPDGVSLRDVDVAVDVKLALASITGAPVVASIKLRDQGGLDYVYARMIINTSGVITIGIIDNLAGSFLSADTTVPGLVYSSAQTMSLRFQAEGNTFRAKAWATTTGEPYAWQVSGNRATVPIAGNAAVQGWAQTGNTNTKPVIFSMDNLTVRVPRFSGEVASWPQRWDISGNDVYTPIEANGIKRRLGQPGVVPLRSTLYRYYTRLATPPVAYWPGEDSKNAGNQLASGVGGTPLTPLASADLLTLAADSEVLSSAPLVKSGVRFDYNATTAPQPGIVSTGTVASYTATSQVMYRFIIRIPLTAPDNPEIPDNSDIARVTCAGTVGDLSPTYRSGGGLGLVAYSGSTTPYYDSGPITFPDVRNRNLLFSVQLTQSGPDVAWNLSILEVGQTAGLQFSSTITGRTLGAARFAWLDSSLWIRDFVFGHVAVRKENAGFSDIVAPLNGYIGEAAGVRIQRLCAEEGVAFAYRGGLTATTAMGPQGAGSANKRGGENLRLIVPSTGQTLLDFLQESEDADGGTLYEPRGDIGLAYRTCSDAYTQIPQLDLDYTAGQVAPPLEPIDDDQLTRNNITVTRVNGQSAEAELTLGRMSTLDPSAGGVGIYDAQYTLNVASDDQLPDLATRYLARGTADEARYPTVTVNLANPDTVALESDALAVDVDDRITISNPKTGTTPDQISQIVRGYTETLNTFTHTLAFNCSPESPYRGAAYDFTPVFRFDTDTSTLSSGVSSTATSISVANVGQPWSAAAGDMPIPILIAGEQMNVTAVTGSSTPQTFTVIRSVNGVVKAQLAGAVVQIYPPNSPAYAL